jgi:hypothetical protein
MLEAADMFVLNASVAELGLLKQHQDAWSSTERLCKCPVYLSIFS